MDDLYKTLKEIFSNDDIKEKHIETSYDDILFQQIKELQSQLETCKKEKQEIEKKFNDMKLLLGNN